MNQPPVDFFTKEHASLYDERNRKLAPISDALHFLTNLVLKNLPVRARILSVGAGTGAEILSLATAFPGWSFVAVDPSLSMLDVCRERISVAGISDRCTFIHGFAADLPPTPSFDAALAIFVAHFLKRAERVDFYSSMISRLHEGGYLVNAEISSDLDSVSAASMVGNWASVQALMGATPESLASLPRQLREVLTILPESQVETLLRQSGIAVPVRFYQAFMISAWYGVKGAQAVGGSR